MTINTAQQTLIDNFALLGEWMERYKYIIDLGDKLPSFPDEFHTDEHKVKGCLSQVWMHLESIDGRIHIHATSDSAIVCGLIAILKMLYHEQTPDTILNTPTTFIQQLGLDQHLSPTRNNGLYAMLNHIKMYAKKKSVEEQYANV